MANPWRELAVNDLEKIRDLVNQNHPGPLDTQNPWFKEWLSQGYAEAIALTKNIRTYQGYYFSVKYFVNGFKDGHLTFESDLKVNRVAWPGFTVAKRGNRFIVHHVSTDWDFIQQPMVGAEVLSCDGKAIRQLLEENIFPYSGNKDLAAHWIRQTPMLWVDQGNPFTKPLDRCKYRVYSSGQGTSKPTEDKIKLLQELYCIWINTLSLWPRYNSLGFRNNFF